MARALTRDLMRWRRAADVSRSDRVILHALIGAGILLLIRFGDWWFRASNVASIPLFVVLSLAVWYGITRIVLGWINIARIRVDAHRPAPAGMSVAIFTTSSPGEPLAMFEKTLAACAHIRYPHTTYLLDDTCDPRMREAAERHGAVWLELIGIPGAKAGKINAALQRTTERFILVLDPDHIPFPNFLDRVLGHFHDDDIGFVQVAQAYYNQSRSFVARGAAEQTYSFYGPTQLGLHGHGAAVAIGANCTFRRDALQTIGGHGIGLAEDLVTSIRLHASKWRSVYVPEVLSRGLVPEDLGSFYKQQLKWARGVYEVMFAELPSRAGTLSWWQRLSYAAIGTYYLFGVTAPMYLALPYVYLWTGVQPAAMRFDEFIVMGGPVAIVAVVIYLFSQRWMCDVRHERGLHLRGMMLKVACWPIFLAGTVLAIARAEIPYIPTAKEAVRGRFFRLAWPLLVLLVLYTVTVGWTIYNRLLLESAGTLVLTSQAVWGMIGFATLAAMLSVGGVYAAWQARTPGAGAAWDDIDLELIECDVISV
ncbi:MAG: glycosyltransferase family 2 protein [Longimicrobiales bacterium]